MFSENYVPRNQKNNEFRKALTPSGVSMLRKSGHAVILSKALVKEVGLSMKSIASAGAEVLSLARGLGKVCLK